MSHAALTFEELLTDFELTAACWQTLFVADPGAAEVSVDIAGPKDLLSGIYLPNTIV